MADQKFTPTRKLVGAGFIEFVTRISLKGWIILALNCAVLMWTAASCIPQFQCPWNQTCVKAPPLFR